MKKAMFIIFLVFWSMVLCCQPNIKFDTMLIDFGNIQQTSGVIKGKFHFTNTGTKPLLINKVQSSGGILSVIDYTRDTIYMNKSGTISFMCSITSSSIQTSFTKSISIYSNVINSPHVVLVKGAILPYSEENNTLESYGFSITGFENYGYTLQIDTTNVDEIIARSEIIGHFNLVNNNDSIIELKNFGWSIDNMAFKIENQEDLIIKPGSSIKIKFIILKGLTRIIGADWRTFLFEKQDIKFEKKTFIDSADIIESFRLSEAYFRTYNQLDFNGNKIDVIFIIPIKYIRNISYK